MPTFNYKAVRIRQTEGAKNLLLFGAPAADVNLWAGAPQKKELAAGEETTGFQRDLNEQRLRGLKDFYSNPSNIIQNPLLCATRDASIQSIRFDPSPGQPTDASVPIVGTVTIEAEDLEQLSLLELLQRVKADLERRLPALKTQKVAQLKLLKLKQGAQLGGNATGDALPETEDAMSEDSTVEGEQFNSESTEQEDAAAIVFSDESHIFDFWEDVAARVSILEEGGPSLRSAPDFAGYSKDAMIAFLRPVVIVDGQHRLMAATTVARAQTSQSPFKDYIEQEILKGRDATEVQRDAERNASRILPVSLLLTDDPAEHVFQFVVVNQKATPIDRALLGTIVSTSLSNEELSRVSHRLTSAGIPLGESRSVAYLTRNPNSPFFNLVERGLASDKEHLMPWTVLGSLIRIFQMLKGGRLFHEKVDYAALWKRRHLNDSGLVAQYQDRGFESAYAFWSAPDGPWRDVFVTFFRCIRDRLATVKDEDAWHYWGAGRESNIFNKISLTILSADFFQSLCDSKRKLDSLEDVVASVDDWLRDISGDYFNRDWKLEGIKKDSPGIRKRWSKLWLEYRKDPERLPPAKMYRQSMQGD